MDNTKAADKGYTVLRLDASRLEDLEDLHMAVYGRRPDKGHFARKYDTGYTGVEYIGYIAYNEDIIPVAYYGVIPCLVYYRGVRYLSAQSCDTMTDPRFRYKGMFVELSMITFTLCKVHGIQFIFGFPNENSWHGAVQKLGWKIAGTMERFTIPVKTLPLLGLCAKFPWMEGFYKVYTRLVLRPYATPQLGFSTLGGMGGGAGAGEAGVGGGFGGVLRDEAYLKYKTYSPTAVIRVGGVDVWIRIRDGLFVGDMRRGGRGAMTPGGREAETDIMTREDLEKAMRSLKKIAARLGLPHITFLTSPGTGLHALFSEAYTAVPSFPVLIQELGTTLVWEEFKFTFADIDVF